MGPWLEETLPYGPWEEVPRWHWRRLFGFDIRHWVRTDPFAYEGEGYWRYGRSWIIVHEELRKQYAPTEQSGTSFTFD